MNTPPRPAPGPAGKPKALLRPALVLFLVITLITGVIYPAAIAALGAGIFPDQSAGSLVRRGGAVVGSSLIGQNFADAGHFWARPSATAPQPYNGLASTGSNLSLTNPAQIDAVRARLKALHEADPDNRRPVPVDLVTASGSGLDPEISPAAALYQVERVARARGLAVATVHELVQRHTAGRQWGVLGEPRVNVLLLNLALDEAEHHVKAPPDRP